MDEINKIIKTLISEACAANSKSPLRNLGFLSCTNTITIKHAPFYDPCLLLVLSGTKTLFTDGKATRCTAGSLLAVPGPSSFDIRNEPDVITKKYTALIIPFKVDLLDRVTRSHSLVHEVRHEAANVIIFAPENTLHESIHHYLTTLGNAKLLDHRLMEILLILATRNSALLSFGLHRPQWAGRVRATLSADLAHIWTLAEVCKRLATTESTLRRNLRSEDTNFREVLYELRLASALTQLLQTSLPIYRIAYDCGYQSVSRFTSNFHKRFGVPPKQFRAAASDSEQNLTA